MPLRATTSARAATPLCVALATAETVTTSVRLVEAPAVLLAVAERDEEPANVAVAWCNVVGANTVVAPQTTAADALCWTLATGVTVATSASDDFAAYDIFAAAVKLLRARRLACPWFAEVAVTVEAQCRAATPLWVALPVAVSVETPVREATPPRIR